MKTDKTKTSENTRKQVKTLEKQVKALEKQVKTLERYKSGYELLIQYFDSISDEEQVIVNRELKKLKI